MASMCALPSSCLILRWESGLAHRTGSGPGCLLEVGQSVERRRTRGQPAGPTKRRGSARSRRPSDALRRCCRRPREAVPEARHLDPARSSVTPALSRSQRPSSAEVRELLFETASLALAQAHRPIGARDPPTDSGGRTTASGRPPAPALPALPHRDISASFRPLRRQYEWDGPRCTILFAAMISIWDSLAKALVLIPGARQGPVPNG